jgi:uncharacterized protein YndB with AHSA1/START domain
MTTTTVTRTIQASIESVYEAVAHIENFQAICPHITNVEFLSENKTGVGARFTETRQMGKREGKTTLEVTEYVPNERIRLVSDQGGTIWDTVFTTKPSGSGSVELNMVMEAKAYKFLAKLVNPLLKGMIRRFVEKDLDAVKAHCEK